MQMQMQQLLLLRQLIHWQHEELAAYDRFLGDDISFSGEQFPQIGHDHNGPETYSDSLLYRVSFSEHQEHEHQSKELALYLPESRV